MIIRQPIEWHTEPLNPEVIKDGQQILCKFKDSEDLYVGRHNKKYNLYNIIRKFKEIEYWALFEFHKEEVMNIIKKKKIENDY